MGLFDGHVFVLTLGGNIDREIIDVDNTTTDFGDYQGDMKGNIDFIQPSFADRNKDIFETKVEHCLVHEVQQLLNHEIDKGAIEYLLKRLDALPDKSRVIVTAPAGRLIDLAQACSESIKRIVFTGVDDVRDNGAKRETLMGSVEVLLQLYGKQEIMIFRGGKVGPPEKWTTKLGHDGQPFDVQCID